MFVRVFWFPTSRIRHGFQVGPTRFPILQNQNGRLVTPTKGQSKGVTESGFQREALTNQNTLKLETICGNQEPDNGKRWFLPKAVFADTEPLTSGSFGVDLWFGKR